MRPRVPFRSGIIEGVGGRQLILDDPSGNPVELFSPTRREPGSARHERARPRARLGGESPRETLEVLDATTPEDLMTRTIHQP